MTDERWVNYGGSAAPSGSATSGGPPMCPRIPSGSRHGLRRLAPELVAMLGCAVAGLGIP